MPGMQLRGVEALADFFGVSHQTIHNWQHEGLPITERGGPNVPSLFDSADCIAWYVQRHKQRAWTETPRDRVFKLQAEDLELVLASKRRRLVPAADLKPRVRAIVSAARAALLGEPARLSAQMDKLDRRGREDLMRQEFEAFLRKLAGGSFL